MAKLGKILDTPTKTLLSELSKDFDISFKRWLKGYTQVYIQNNNADISYNPIGVKSESIAHELLHIWLKKFNYLSPNHLFLSFESDAYLSRVFTKRLCDHIGNCMDHYKMYPKYTEMGYSPKQFLKNGLKEKCSILEIKTLKFDSSKKVNPTMVDHFIGHTIAINADHVNNDYTQHNQLLEKLNPELFQIVNQFWNDWISFDIENIDPIYNSDFDLYANFISNMENWVENGNNI